MRKSRIGAIAEKGGSVVKRLECDIAVPAGRIVFKIAHVLPRAALVAGDGGGERCTASVRPRWAFLRFVRTLRMIVPHGEQIARGQTLDRGRRKRRGSRPRTRASTSVRSTTPRCARRQGIRATATSARRFPLTGALWQVQPCSTDRLAREPNSRMGRTRWIYWRKPLGVWPVYRLKMRQK